MALLPSPLAPASTPRSLRSLTASCFGPSRALNRRELSFASLHAPSGNEIGIPLTEIEDWRCRVHTFEATGAYGVTELTIRGSRRRWTELSKSRILHAVDS